MANFPGSVYAPSAVANGQTIDASRDNGQDAEITAIEQGYLQGSAPLNSSNSTVANLSVAGSCTFAGGVTFAGGSTVTTLNVTSGSTFAVRPIMPPPDAVRVFAQSTHALASSQASTLVFQSQDFVTNSSVHSTTTNPDRLTPQSTGVYRVDAQIAFPIASAILARQVSIWDSSGGTVGTAYEVSTSILFLRAGGTKRVDVTGTYFRCIFGSNGASTMSISTGNDNSWFALTKL